MWGFRWRRSRGPLVALEKPYPGVRFLTFGFGERQFLVDRRTDFGSMLRAMLPSQSVLLMTALKAPPEQAFGAGNVIALQVSRAGLERIEAAIWRELERSATGEAVRLAEGAVSRQRVLCCCGHVFWVVHLQYLDGRDAA